MNPLTQRLLGLKEASDDEFDVPVQAGEPPDTTVRSTPDTVTIGNKSYHYNSPENIAVAIVIGNDQVFELKGGGHQTLVDTVQRSRTLRTAMDKWGLLALTAWYPKRENKMTGEAGEEFGYSSFLAGRIWPKLKIFNFWALKDRVVPKYLPQIEGAALLADIDIEEYSFSFGDVTNHLIHYADLRKAGKTVSPEEQSRREKEAELAQQAHLMTPDQKFMLQKAGLIQKPKEFGAGLKMTRASAAGYDNPAAWGFARRQGLGDALPVEIVNRLLN